MTEIEHANVRPGTRQHAIESGDLMDVSGLARHAGLGHPLAMTSAVLADIQNVPEGSQEQERDRLCDLVSAVAAKAIHPAIADERGLVFAVSLEQPGTARDHSYHVRLTRETGDAGETVYTLLRADESVSIHNATATEALKRVVASIREEIAQNAAARDRLYVGLVQTDWKHHEDEEAYLRADEAVDTLYSVAHTLGMADAVETAADEGRRRLREHMEDRKDNGPTRLAEVEKEIERIKTQVPASDSTESGETNEGREEEKRQASQQLADLQFEKTLLRDDLELAADTLSYLDGEDIEHS